MNVNYFSLVTTIKIPYSLANSLACCVTAAACSHAPGRRSGQSASRGSFPHSPPHTAAPPRRPRPPRPASPPAAHPPAAPAPPARPDPPPPPWPPGPPARLAVVPPPRFPASPAPLS